MSSTNTNKSSDFHSDSSAQNKDIRSGDYDVRQGADKEKNEKTTITLEKKKEKDTDKNMKDVHKQDTSSSEGKGIMNTIKDKVKDVLGSGDNDKQKDVDKEKYSEHNKNAGFTASSGSDKHSNLGAGHQQQQHTTNLGATTSSDKDKYSNLGSSGSSGQYSSGMGSSGSSGQYSSGVGSSGSSGHYSSGMGVNTSSDKFSSDKHSNLSGDKHSSSAAHSGPATINRTGLGAEHREVGYENVIPSKEKDYGMQNKNVEYHSGVAPSSIDKDKDSAHKVDLHASLKTGSAAGSTSGSQASTYKTTESK